MDLPRIPLPGTSRSLTRIGLGTMHLSLPGRPDRSRAKAVLRAAVEAGIGLIDTADAYSLDDGEHGHNESLVAEALREMGLRLDAPDAPVVATKGGRSRPAGDWALDARPERLREACHDSLRRMGVDRLPLHQLHQPDPAVPFAEQVGALARLREEGKVEAVGLSNVSADQIREAQELVPVASVQNAVSPWSVDRRKSEVVRCCEDEGRPLLAYSPLGGRDRATGLADSPGLQRVAASLGATPQEVVLAWLLLRSPVLVPIPGATRPATARSSARAGTVELTSSDTDAVLEALRTLPGRPGLLGRAARSVLHRLRSLAD